jgi:hypothetical protein
MHQPLEHQVEPIEGVAHEGERPSIAADWAA